MPELEDIAATYHRLSAELATTRDQLADAIRAEHQAGATYVQLLKRSGYTSVETIRQIVKPEARERNNRVRRAS